MRIDLHTHTTCSDGQYTPEELVQKAAAAGICSLAITDHDAVSGIARGKQAAKAFPQLQIFPGIEISAKENPQLHILGYGIDGENADLQAYITRNRTLRQGRRERMLAFLAEKGAPVTIEEVAAANNGCTTGRPHFAKTMLLKGYVSSAVSYTHLRARGIAVLAHPAKLNLSQPDFLQLLSTLCEAGLRGIEAYYSTHSPEEMAWYADIAAQHGLFCTCGSDFHGEIIKPDIALGTGRNHSLCLPDELECQILERFQAALSK